MTVEEIYSTIAAHMVKGMMIHSQMSEYYYFLNLAGYGACHEYHFLKESQGYQDFVSWYITTRHKLLPEFPVETPSVIPASWHKYTTMDIDASTIKSAVNDGLEKWVGWETETCELYEKMYLELLDIGEVYDTMKLQEMICEVHKELSDATKYKLNKEMMNFDIPTIISEQDHKHKKYQEKIRELW